MVRAIAKEKNLTKTTLQHIKSVLSTIFTYAKNEGAFDGANPVDSHAFRRGLASNLYAMGAQDKVVQRILRHSKPHVTRERYIKVFDRTVLDAVVKPPFCRQCIAGSVVSC